MRIFIFTPKTILKVHRVPVVKLLAALDIVYMKAAVLVLLEPFPALK